MMPTPRAGESEDDFVDRCIPIVIDDGTAEDGEQAAAVCHSMWRKAKKMIELKAVWNTAYINDLPDSAFLYVESGGKKDEDGKTVPRSLRHFPYKDASGKIDLPHLRNAIARIPQANIPAEKKRSLQEKARRLLAEQNKSALYIKSIDDDIATIGGYGIVWGAHDLEGDTFTPETDLMADFYPTKPVFYQHSQDKKIPDYVGIAKNENAEADDWGLWVESQIDLSKEYARHVMPLIEAGVLGYSSGTASHLARRQGGKILRWPVVEYSLTPTPAEPRTLGVSQIKALFDAAGLSMPEAFNEADEANAAELPAKLRARILLLGE